ncbi:MAG: rhomboid family intramembrane serine protease [Planctomycetes bacterium]|nr:rhomboid family intramembrane serine protease [Planctomycetota bacterium]
MKCPSCGAILQQDNYEGRFINHCSQCNGIWFESGELKDYIRLLIEKDKTIPEAKIETKRNVIKPREINENKRNCPKCSAGMEKFNYGYDSNVILDKCVSCDGVWADGNEIKALAIHIKGNQKLDKLGQSLAEYSEQIQHDKDAADVNRFYFLTYIPILVPLGTTQNTRKTSFVFYIFFLINIAVFAYQYFYVKNPGEFYLKHGFIPAFSVSTEGLSRMITSMFIHGDFGHLLYNMIFFLVFADNIEDRFGHWIFPIFYMGCGFCSTIVHGLLYWGSTIPAIGASGAISGAIGAYYMLFPESRIRILIYGRTITTNAYIFLGAWLLYQAIYAVIASVSISMLFSRVTFFGTIAGFTSGAIFAWSYKSHERGNAPIPSMVKKQ